MTRPESACVLCGNSNRNEVAVSVVWWREATPGHVADSIPRCVNRAACRERSIAIDGQWLAADPVERSTPR